MYGQHAHMGNMGVTWACNVGNMWQPGILAQGSLVPRPSASRVRIAYVTFEPLSDSWISDKGSKVTYGMRARLADGLGTRLGTGRRLRVGLIDLEEQSRK